MIRFDVLQITPQQAEAWLANKANNRTVRQRHVRAMAKAMSTGKFRLTHQAIAFDGSGMLIDGEHRLHAVIASGASVWMAVARYPDGAMDARAELDSGAKRSLGEQMEILGQVADRGQDRIAVGRSIALIEWGNIDNRTDVRTERDFALLYAGDYEAIRSRMAHTQYSAPVAAAFVWARSINPDAVDALAGKLGSPVGLSVTEATLLNYLHNMKHAKGGSAERLGGSLRVLRMIEAVLDGESLTKVQEQTRSLLVERMRPRKPEHLR